MDLKRRIYSASGKEESDLVLKNARIVNVFSNEIIESDIAIVGKEIVGIGKGYKGKKELDLKGLYISPGFIDGHIHIESSMVNIPEFTKIVLPHGTTSVIIDPHEIANVMGLEGINYMLKSSKYNPLNVFMMLPSCVPASPFESSGAELKAIDLLPLLNNKWVKGIGEVMSYPEVIEAQDDVLDKIRISSESYIIDGHAPGLKGKNLNAYITAGIYSDHECTSREEALEKLRLGMVIMLRESSSAHNLLELLPLVNSHNHNRFFFVSDDKSPNDLIEKGHIDYMIKLAIKNGLNPIIAIKLATFNTASYFQLKKLGAIAPGYIADLVAFDDFENLGIKMVFKNGELVYRDGELIYNTPVKVEYRLRGSVNIKWLELDDFMIPAKSNRCRIIKIVPDQIITKQEIDEPLIEDGKVISDTKRDILKIFVIERHTASETIGKGLVRGFGLKSGAIATTVAHDSHNLLCLGVDDADIKLAAITIAKIKGGLVLVNKGKVLEALPLPIAGLMSDQSIYFVRDKLESLKEKIKQLGVKLSDPFMSLSFLALSVIPEIKITNKGLVDVNKYKIVDLFV